MAEGLARGLLPGHTVTSAGFLMEGAPATEEAVATLAARGIDISEHLSRVVTPAMIEASDLVLTMTSQHVAEVAVMSPELWGRAFTLRDFARRLSATGGPQPSEPVAQWLSRLNAGRTPRDVLSAAAGDDIADPIGLPVAAYERTADELTTLLAQLSRAL